MFLFPCNYYLAEFHYCVNTLSYYNDPKCTCAVGHDMLLCEDLDSYQCVAINPVEPRLVAVSNARNGTSLYDTRNRKE